MESCSKLSAMGEMQIKTTAILYTMHSFDCLKCKRLAIFIIVEDVEILELLCTAGGDLNHFGKQSSNFSIN